MSQKQIGWTELKMLDRFIQEYGESGILKEIKNRILSRHQFRKDTKFCNRFEYRMKLVIDIVKEAEDPRRTVARASTVGTVSTA